MTPAEIKAWRKRLGLTQREAAALTTVPKRTWEGWESESSGKSPPPFLPRLLELVAAEQSRKLVPGSDQTT